MVHKYNLVPFAEHSVNATGIDNRNMMPDEHSMQIMWAGWSLISFLAAFICIMIFAAVLVSKEARKSGFNLYLAALMVPDIFFSLNCGITCAMNHAKRMYVSVFMCKYQTFYCTFGIAGSFWLNAVVAHEVYKVLKQKPGLGVFRGPSTKGVVYKSLAVYLFTTLVSSLPNWGVLPISGFPIRGLACIATWDNLEEELFFWFVFYPLSAGIPAVCCFYIAYRCWREKLLVVNRKGVWVQSPDDAMVRSIAYKRKAREGRQLVFYFARIFLVVIAMWVPSTIFFFGDATRDHWAFWFGVSWGHLQGFMSAAVSLTKPDVLEAVMELVCCRKVQDMAAKSSSRVLADADLPKVEVPVAKDLNGICPAEV